MGDRGNIFMKEDMDDSGVYLYTHWRGSELPKLLQTALQKKARWNDGPYLARIIFDVMTEGYHGEEAGFGISCFLEDGDDKIIIVDVDKWGRRKPKVILPDGREFTFDEYIKLKL